MLIGLDATTNLLERCHNFSQSVLRHIEKMIWIAMQGLHERRIEMNDASRPENATQLSCRKVRIRQMFKHRLTHHSIKRLIPEGQAATRTDQIGPLILNGIKIDHVRPQQILGSVASPEIEHEARSMAPKNVEHI